MYQAQPGRSAAARRQALAALKDLLADPEAARKRDGRPAVDAAFAQQALARLTAPELVALTDWQAAAGTQAAIPWYRPEPYRLSRFESWSGNNRTSDF